LGLSNELKADCMACWEIYTVEFQVEAEESKIGHIKYKPARVGYSKILYPEANFEGLQDFCDTLSYLYQLSSDILIVYDEVVQVPKYFRKFPLALSHGDTIDIDNLLNMTLLKNTFPGSEGAGAIPIITKAQYQLLINQTPIAHLKRQGYAAFSDAYWFSYDPSIREEELKEIGESHQPGTQYHDLVFFVSLAYD